MAILFFDVKLKEKVPVDEKNVRKVAYETKSGKRYALRAKTSDNRKLTKFTSKADWDKLNVPVGDFTD